MSDGPFPPWRASWVTAGCEAQGKAEAFLFHPGTAGKGKAGRVNVSESSYAAVSRVAAQLGVAWWTVMDQVIGRGTPLIEDPARLDPPLGDLTSAPVRAVGVDETAFLRATGTHPTLFATGIAELTPGRAARLLDVVEGRSGAVLADWLADRTDDWKAAVATASLDPFRGYATALTTQLPDAIRVLDPFHVVKLGLDCVDEVRRRVQQNTLGHRGRARDPLYDIRRLLRRRRDRPASRRGPGYRPD